MGRTFRFGVFSCSLLVATLDSPFPLELGEPIARAGYAHAFPFGLGLASLPFLSHPRGFVPAGLLLPNPTGVISCVNCNLDRASGSGASTGPGALASSHLQPTSAYHFSHVAPLLLWSFGRAATGAAAARGRPRPGVIARPTPFLVGRWIGRAGGPWLAGTPALGARVFVCTCFSLDCTPLLGPAAVAAPGAA